MVHSDRERSILFDELHVVQSFSQKGYPFDNAVCESFFRRFKREEADPRTYRSRQALYLAVFDYIEGFYNSHRPHASLGWLIPDQVEADFCRLSTFLTIGHPAVTNLFVHAEPLCISVFLIHPL